MKVIGQALGAFAAAVFAIIILVIGGSHSVLLVAALAYIIGAILMFVPIFSDVMVQILPIEKADIPALFVLVAVLGAFFKMSVKGESDSE